MTTKPNLQRILERIFQYEEKKHKKDATKLDKQNYDP